MQSLGSMWNWHQKMGPRSHLCVVETILSQNLLRFFFKTKSKFDDFLARNIQKYTKIDCFENLCQYLEFC